MSYAITEIYRLFISLFLLMWGYFHCKLVAFLCEHVHVLKENLYSI